MAHLLSSPLLNINPFICSNEQIVNFIRNRAIVKDDTYISEFNDIEEFCTLVHVDQTMEREYNGVRFKSVVFRGVDYDFSLPINYSQFRYSMHPLRDNTPLGLEHYEYIPASVKCTINFRETNPSIFETGNQQLFYSYSFPTLNDYRKKKRCYRFLECSNLESKNMEAVRLAIIHTQWFVLKQLLERTKLFTVPTFLYLNNQRICGPDIGKDISLYFEEYFNNNYKNDFWAILHDVESAMNSRHVACPDKYWM